MTMHQSVHLPAGDRRVGVETMQELASTIWKQMEIFTIYWEEM